MPHRGVDFGGRAMAITVIALVARVLTWIIIIDAILSFFPTIDRRNPIVVLLRRITEPLYAPLRKVIPPVRMGDAGLDLSPLILLIGIQILAQVLISIIAST